MRLIAVITVSAALLAFQPVGTHSSPKESGETIFQVRTGQHPQFLRIVLQGEKNILTRGTVTAKGKNVIVKMPTEDFILHDEGKKISWKKQGREIIFATGHGGKHKMFFLNNPDRMVIDYFGDGSERKSSAIPQKAPKASSGQTVSKEKPEPRTKPSSAKAQSAAKNTVKQKIAVGAEQNNGEEEISSDASIIPKRYRALWDLLQEGNAYKVLKLLPDFVVKDDESLAAQHFLYAETFRIMKKYPEAIERYSLAYIYAVNSSMKETSLLRRAELYGARKFYYEARGNYIIFIRDYPSSRHISRAHLGLAHTSASIGLLQEAVNHYEKAGRQAEALFGKANALQRLGRVEEARKAYAEGMKVDQSYPSRSAETFYYMGENYRTSGNLREAKEQFLAIQRGTLKDKASISLGLVALEEDRAEEAIRHLLMATRSNDKKIRAEAHYNLAVAFASDGQLPEAIAELEKIHYTYSDTAFYGVSLLELARLYRTDGKVEKAIRLLKELVYGKDPPDEAFHELEMLLVQASEDDREKGAGKSAFIDLWREVGQWMLDESREDFLLGIVEQLRQEGRPFLEVCSWLVENASEKARNVASIHLADYHAGMGNVRLAESYLDNVRKTAGPTDGVLSVEARIDHVSGKPGRAFEKMKKIKSFGMGELKLMGKILLDLERKGDRRIRDATAYYEDKVISSGGGPEEYVRLADLLYELDEKQKALEHYKTAFEKEPENQWTKYRVSAGDRSGRTKEMLRELQSGNTLLSRFAKTKLLEMNLLSRLNEVY